MDSAITLKSVHDRPLAVTVLVLPVVLAWTYVLLGTQQTIAMPGDRGLESTAVFIMWAVMMIAMMLPSATKVVLLAATLDDQNRSLLTVRRAGLFASGYLAVWLAFSLAATAAQWVLDKAGLLSPSMLISNATLAGSLLLYAGVYQWTPLKQRCLIHCRDPQEFLARHWWRDGPFGTGLRHGLFCFGCCWMLMGLLFVGGLMNLAGIAVVAFAILAEKTMPLGIWTSRAIGIALVVGGAITLATSG